MWKIPQIGHTVVSVISVFLLCLWTLFCNHLCETSSCEIWMLDFPRFTLSPLFFQFSFFSMGFFSSIYMSSISVRMRMVPKSLSLVYLSSEFKFLFIYIHNICIWMTLKYLKLLIFKTGLMALFHYFLPQCVIAPSIQKPEIHS